jgi:hypothetical protein
MTDAPLWLIVDSRTGRYLQPDGKRGPRYKALVVPDVEKNKSGICLTDDDKWEPCDPAMAIQIATFQRRGTG